MDGADMVVSPEGRSHSINGGMDCLRYDSCTLERIVFGAEAALPVGSCKGADDTVLDPGLEFGEEGIVIKVDVLEEGKVVAPVCSLLRIGGDGDAIGLGNLRSQVSSCEHSSGGKGEMLKSGGTWSGMEDRNRWVSVSGFKSVSRESESDKSFSTLGNHWLNRPKPPSITIVANARAISSWSGCVSASKFDFRIHPAADVLSVWARMISRGFTPPYLVSM
jgi:hypothetical protein